MDPVHRTVTPDPGNPAGLDYAAFLRDTLATQPHNLAAYVLTRSDGSQPPEQVWLKKAGPHLGAWRATLLGAVARLVRLEALRPVPNPGGRAAIHTEARRLAALHARGLRVPAVLAVQDDALLLRHLGEPGAPTKSLADELYDAARDVGGEGSTPVRVLCSHHRCKPPSTTRPARKKATSRPSRRIRRSWYFL